MKPSQPSSHNGQNSSPQPQPSLSQPPPSSSRPERHTASPSVAEWNAVQISPIERTVEPSGTREEQPEETPPPPSQPQKEIAVRVAPALRWLTYLLLMPLIALATTGFGCISLICGMWDKSGRQQHAIAQLWARVLLLISLSPVELIGREKLHLHEVAVYASNHLSYYDTPVLFAKLPFQFRILAKQGLWKVPFIGWYLNRSGQVPVDQSSGRAAVASLSRGVAALKSGLPLVIFPEGGRAADGQTKTFLSGCAFMAIKAGVPPRPADPHRNLRTPPDPHLPPHAPPPEGHRRRPHPHRRPDHPRRRRPHPAAPRRHHQNLHRPPPALKLASTTVISTARPRNSNPGAPFVQLHRTGGVQHQISARPRNSNPGAPFVQLHRTGGGPESNLSTTSQLQPGCPFVQLLRTGGSCIKSRHDLVHSKAIS